MEEKEKNPFSPTQIDGKWYLTGGGLKIPVESEEYAATLARVLFNIEIPNPFFTPGRKKKNV
jgi:hypothetical protein